MILHVAEGSSWWLFAAANLILFLHVAGGTVGIISGAIALLSRKGGRAHRIAGTVFLVSMLIMASIGAATSPFLPVPSMTNVAAGTLTLYLCHHRPRRDPLPPESPVPRDPPGPACMSV